MSATVYYDGECPFCRSYVEYARLKERFGDVSLVDARTAPEKAAEFLAKGLDIDEGFIVEADGHLYHGAEAMRLIHAELAPKSTGLSRLADDGMLQRLYPVLVAGRNLTLKALGRKKINDRR
jgi:predicted DCC family thiol-disulfide oxidoreductase YuxK